LLKVTEKSTGQAAVVLAAVGFGRRYGPTPMVRKFDGNPFDELEPLAATPSKTRT
jgi:hypothetical protein